MRIAPFALSLLMAFVPVAAQVQDLGLATDEQILLKQVMADKRAVYAKNLGLTETESRAFWPVYDEYEGKVKKVNDRILALVNDYVAKYETLTDADAAAMSRRRWRSRRSALR